MPERIGAYRIVRVLGEGGMGTVYEAEQESPRRLVALKVIRPHLVATARYRRRFAEEVRTLGRFSHPAIARIFEAGSAPDDRGAMRLFCVMELVVGVPLDRHVASRGLAPGAIAELMATICDAVHHAHLKGVIHCDLKPGNIVVDGDGTPRILDFGIARIIGDEARDALAATASLGGEGGVFGTLAFASPEQAVGDRNRIDAMTDVYGLGATLYALLAGRPPHHVAQCGAVEAARLIELGSPADVRAVTPACPMNLHAVVDKATRRRQGDRYDSAAAMTADLRRFASGQPVVARPAPWSERSAAWIRRNRLTSASIAAASLAVVVGVAAVGGTLAQLSHALTDVRAEQGDHAMTRLAIQGSQLFVDARHQRSRAYWEHLPSGELPGYAGCALAAIDWHTSTSAGQDPFMHPAGRLLTLDDQGHVVDRLDILRTWPEWAAPRFDLGGHFRRGCRQLQESRTVAALGGELDGDPARELVRGVRVENHHLHLSVLAIDDMRSVILGRGALSASGSQIWNHGEFVDVIWDESRGLLWSLANADELPYFVPELAGWDSAGCPIGEEVPRLLVAIDPLDLRNAPAGSGAHRVMPPLAGDADHQPAKAIWAFATRPPPSMRDVACRDPSMDVARGGDQPGVVQVSIQAFAPFPTDDDAGRLGRLYVTFRYLDRDHETIASVDLDARGAPMGPFQAAPLPRRNFDEQTLAVIARTDPAKEIMTLDLSAISAAAPTAESLLRDHRGRDAALAALGAMKDLSTAERKSIARCVDAMTDNWRWLNDSAGEIIERDKILATIGGMAESAIDPGMAADISTALARIAEASRLHGGRCPGRPDGPCVCECFMASNLALGLAAAGQWEACLDAARRSIDIHAARRVDLDSDDPVDHAIRAIALHALGRQAEAEDAMATAEAHLATMLASPKAPQGGAGELAPRICARARAVVRGDS